MKVRCIRNNNGFFTVGKIYEVKNGRIYDNSNYGYLFTDIESYNAKGSSQFQLLDDVCESESSKVSLIKGDNNMKLLDIYKEKKSLEFEKECDAKISKLQKEDVNQIKVDKIKSQIDKVNEEFKKQFRNGYTKIYLENDYNIYTNETTDKISEVHTETKFKFDTLNNLIKEVSARLELCENETSKIQVLKDYKILDEFGKINV